VKPHQQACHVPFPRISPMFTISCAENFLLVNFFSIHPTYSSSSSFYCSIYKLIMFQFSILKCQNILKAVKKMTQIHDFSLFFLISNMLAFVCCCSSCSRVRRERESESVDCEHPFDWLSVSNLQFCYKFFFFLLLIWNWFFLYFSL
jgi:thiosulfate reductase cytochrome b subunit